MVNPVPLLLVTCTGCASSPEIPTQSLPNTGDRSIHDTTQRSDFKVGMPSPTAPDSSVEAGWTSPKSRPSTDLRWGSQGAAVVELQTRLRQLGYPVGSIDGNFGSQTQAAVLQFQQQQGLKTDGIAGGLTLVKLQAAIGQSSTKQEQPPEQSVPPNSNETMPKNSKPTAPIFPKPVSSSAPTEWIDNSPLFSNGQIWFIGWFVTQGIGWLIIFKDFHREVRRVKWAPLPSGASHLTPATLSPINLPVSPTAILAAKQNLGASVTPDETVEVAPVTESLPQTEILTASSYERSSNDQIPVIDADQKIAPSCDVFALAAATSLPKFAKSAALPSEKKQHTIYPVTAPAVPIPTTAKPEPKTITTNEIVVAKLPIDDEACTYSLVDDGDGFFVIRGNELRCDRQQLQAQGGIQKKLTICRTDAQGNSVHKSFNVDLRPSRQPGRVA